MVDLSRDILAHASYFKDVNGDVLNDPRVVVYVNDGRHHLQMQPLASYDLITLEPPPIGYAGVAALYSKEFYTLVRDRLTPGGAMTLQAGMTKLGELDFFASIHRTLREVFPVVAGYQTFISCFGTPWGFITATKKVDPYRQDIATIDRLIADRVKGPMAYWDGQTHQHAFNLPRHIRAAINAQTRVVTDAHPLIVT